MSGYGVEEVQRVLRLSRGTIRGLVRKGFVTPGRARGRAWRFSVKDLVVLRAARDLSAAKIPARRINRSLGELRRRLPDEAPLSGLQISAVGAAVVVREGARHWDADSRQYLLAFGVAVDEAGLRIVERSGADATAEDWFDEALRLEDEDRQRAIAAYQEATRLDGGFAEAWLNQGRLLQSMGLCSRAEAVYRSGIRRIPDDALLRYNYAVLLEAMDRDDEALESYLEALRLDPALADAHYNLAGLCHERGDLQAAFRHFGAWRRLVR
jgi:tetratricopeptide (TPR) repeat protein